MTLRKSNRKHQSCPQAARRNTRIAVLAPTRRNTLITSGAVATPTSSPPAEETASHLSNYTSPDPPANAAVAQTALMPAPRTSNPLYSPLLNRSNPPSASPPPQRAARNNLHFNIRHAYLLRPLPMQPSFERGGKPVGYPIYFREQMGRRAEKDGECGPEWGVGS